MCVGGAHCGQVAPPPHPQVAGFVFPLLGRIPSHATFASPKCVCGEKETRILWETKAAATQRQRGRGLSSAATCVSKSQKALGQGHKRSPVVSADHSGRTGELHAEKWRLNAGGVSGAARRHRGAAATDTARVRILPANRAQPPRTRDSAKAAHGSTSEHHVGRGRAGNHGRSPSESLEAENAMLVGT